MEIIANFFDFFMHLDTHLNVILQHYGSWAYGIFFLIVFAETGLVVTPFLPGDSLLFVLGTFAAQGVLYPMLLAAVLMVAAILGDSVNYAVGKFLGSRMLAARHIPFFKKEHVEKTHRFYEKYGGKTIILARFIPIIRTFAPFVAGIGSMNYLKFFIYNVTGGILWVLIAVSSGYFFGNIPLVKENFSLVVLLIVVISILPAIVEVTKSRTKTLFKN